MGEQNAAVGVSVTAFYLYRGRHITDFFGEFCLVHIDAGPNHDIVNFPNLGFHLRQDSAHLFVVDDDVVGPFDSNGKIRHFPDCLRNRESHDKCECGGMLRREFRPQEQ